MPSIEIPSPNDAQAWFDFLLTQQMLTYDGLPANFAAQQKARYGNTWVASFATAFRKQRDALTQHPPEENLVCAVRHLPGERFVIARHEGQLVGLASCLPAPQTWEMAAGFMPVPAARQLARLYVASQFHSSGLADQLFAAVDDGGPLYLWTLASNARAARYYRKRGFVDLPEEFRASKDWGGLAMRRMLRS